MIVVNLFGGPGSGKSTTAAGVFHALKMRGINAELITEYAKDLTWEKRDHALANQPLILGKQFHRLWRIRDQVEIAITDSPIFLGIVYNKHTGHELEFLPPLIMELHNLFKSVNYYIMRPGDSGYENIGRNHNIAQAEGLDDEIKMNLVMNGIEYQAIERDGKQIEFIVDDLIKLGVGA